VGGLVVHRAPALPQRPVRDDALRPQETRQPPGGTRPSYHPWVHLW